MKKWNELPRDIQEKHPQSMAIKIADESQFNQVAKVLKELGYRADVDKNFGLWETKTASRNFHVLTHKTCNFFGIYNHSGGSKPHLYTFSEFMEKFSTDPLATLPNLSEVKGVMCEVWDDGDDRRFVREVVATSNSGYVVKLDYGAIQLWDNAQPISTQLTRKEVEDK